MNYLPDEPNLSLWISRFNNILIPAVAMDDSTRASQNPYSKSPPLNNQSKLTGVDLAYHEATKAIS